MRTRKICIAVGLALSLIAPVFADTPIGPGVTGAGGTGPNRSDDPSTAAGPGTEVRQADRETNATGGAKAAASASGDAKAGARSGATGATSGGGAGTSGSTGTDVKGGATGGATRY
jgi:hypothetical protein